MGLRVLHYADIETATDHPERVGRLVGLVRALRDAETVVTGGGDNTAPGALSLVTRGRQALDVFSALEPDVATLGNHDFDYGPMATRSVLADAPQHWVAANVRHTGDPFGADIGVRPWTILDRGDERVGIVGVLTPSTPDITPEATGITVTDPVQAVREAVEAFETAGVDHRIVLSHLGDGDADLARAVDVDLVLGGHLHDARLDRVDGTVLARPGANARAVVDARHAADGWTARIVPTDSKSPEPGVVDALTARRRGNDLDAVVGRVADPIPRDRSRSFAGETRIGNLVADAYRWATDADIGLQNAGGIREGPPLAGAVTVGDLVGVVPFDEPVSVGTVSGRDLRRLFAQAAGVNLDFGRSDWWHAHLSGARVVWDDDRELVSRTTVDGSSVDPDRTYTVATSDYLFETPHEFPVLTPSRRVERGPRQYDVLVEYVRSTGIAPAVEGRITRTAFGGRGSSCAASHRDGPSTNG